MQPIAKRCKALGISPAVMGYAKKTTEPQPRQPDERERRASMASSLLRSRRSSSSTVSWKSSSMITMRRPLRLPGKTGDNLLITVERRLDNVVYRMGFAMTRRRGPSAGQPRPLHRQRQEGQHSFLPGQGRRCDRGRREQPLRRVLQAPAGSGRARVPAAHVAGAREERSQGHRHSTSRPRGDRRSR